MTSLADSLKKAIWFFVAPAAMEQLYNRIVKSKIVTANFLYESSELVCTIRF